MFYLLVLVIWISPEAYLPQFGQHSGFEHHRVIVGIIAGLLYNLLLIRQKKLKGVILAHGVTNLGLGIYVLLTGNWMFW